MSNNQGEAAGEATEGVANCAECGAFLERIGPDKYQHPYCSQAGAGADARDALLAECYEWLFESKADGPRVSEGALTNGSYTEAFRDLHDRLRAAMSKEKGNG